MLAISSSEPCHRIALDRLFEPPRSILSPRSPLWLARVTGYLMPNHRRTALGSPKAKTPQDALWSWLLARATARRLTLIKNLACRLARPHRNLRGSQLAFSSKCHSRQNVLYHSFNRCSEVRPVCCIPALYKFQSSIPQPST
jgi:hypothetical protein